MCCSNEHYKQIRLKENAALPTDKLVVLIEDEYRRATWESPEDFTESPNGAHVRLGEVISELRKRLDAGELTEYAFYKNAMEDLPDWENEGGSVVKDLPDSHVNACGPYFKIENDSFAVDKNK
jgi:hypothetical protein